MKKTLLTDCPRLRKIVYALHATIAALFIVLMIVCVIDWIDWKESPETYEMSFFTEFVGTSYLIAIYIILTAIIAILLYLVFSDLGSKKHTAKTESPLLGVAKEHEQAIIDLLKSVAQPLPGKITFNTARVGQFMRALAELGYIDANLDGKYWKPWIEEVTGFTGDTTGHVNAAYKKTSLKDEKVKELYDRIKSIVGDPENL
ncbi:MAG: hypothetical protein IJ814_07735 [Paludibacteraceae bacterium]|nr:hypothetical protein [Paludibacteraceae bacterium]